MPELLLGLHASFGPRRVRSRITELRRDVLGCRGIRHCKLPSTGSQAGARKHSKTCAPGREREQGGVQNAPILVCSLWPVAH